jgi:hypothetical protein
VESLEAAAKAPQMHVAVAASIAEGLGVATSQIVILDVQIELVSMDNSQRLLSDANGSTFAAASAAEVKVRYQLRLPLLPAALDEARVSLEGGVGETDSSGGSMATATARTRMRDLGVAGSKESQLFASAFAEGLRAAALDAPPEGEEGARFALDILAQAVGVEGDGIVVLAAEEPVLVERQAIAAEAEEAVRVTVGEGRGDPLDSSGLVVGAPLDPLDGGSVVRDGTGSDSEDSSDGEGALWAALSGTCIAVFIFGSAGAILLHRRVSLSELCPSFGRKTLPMVDVRKVRIHPAEAVCGEEDVINMPGVMGFDPVDVILHSPREAVWMSPATHTAWIAPGSQTAWAMAWAAPGTSLSTKSRETPRPSQASVPSPQPRKHPPATAWEAWASPRQPKAQQAAPTQPSKTQTPLRAAAHATAEGSSKAPELLPASGRRRSSRSNLPIDEGSSSSRGALEGRPANAVPTPRSVKSGKSDGKSTNEVALPERNASWAYNADHSCFGGISVDLASDAAMTARGDRSRLRAQQRAILVNSGPILEQAEDWCSGWTRVWSDGLVEEDHTSHPPARKSGRHMMEGRVPSLESVSSPRSVVEDDLPGAVARHSAFF